MHKEAELLLSLELPVWASCYTHNLGSDVAYSNVRATEVVKKGKNWISTKGKYLPDRFYDTYRHDPMCIQPTREAAIAHYNQSIDDSLAAMHRIVDGLAPSLMKKKYKV